MSKGYSIRVRDLNLKADQRKIGVILGNLCIQHDIPVMVVADRMKVSRTTVYNWFIGKTEPSPNVTGLIEHYIASLS